MCQHLLVHMFQDVVQFRKERATRDAMQALRQFRPRLRGVLGSSSATERAFRTASRS